MYFWSDLQTNVFGRRKKTQKDQFKATGIQVYTALGKVIESMHWFQGTF